MSTWIRVSTPNRPIPFPSVLFPTSLSAAVREAMVLLMAPKDAGGAPAVWTTATSQVNGAVLFAHMALAVAAAGKELAVWAKWQDDGNQQIFLQRDRRSLARLCLTPTHRADVHWHLFPDVPQPGRMKQIVSANYQAPAACPPERLFFDVFVPTLKLYNFEYQGVFLP